MVSSEDVFKKIQQLPPDLQQELSDIVDYLTSKVQAKGKTKLRLDWAGGIREFRDKFTSLDLQRKALEWWERD